MKRTESSSAIGERLRAALRPKADLLVDQVVELLVTKAAEAWDAASSAAIATVRAQLEGAPPREPDPEPPPPRRRLKRRTSTAPRSAKRPAAAGAKTCGACHKPGHNARTCPDRVAASAPAPEPKPANLPVSSPPPRPPEAVSPPPAPPQSRSSAKPNRFALIERAAAARAGRDAELG